MVEKFTKVFEKFAKVFEKFAKVFEKFAKVFKSGGREPAPLRPGQPLELFEAAKWHPRAPRGELQ
eukprot:570487-Pyramimonas_sp.AAC.1